MKGIVLAGGTGSRLFPLTKITNKHLLPIYDRPMIYYPIETLVKAGIHEILLVTGGKNAGDFLRLLGNGREFGLKHLNSTYQEGEGGIAAALGLAEYFAGGEPICVILGDNIIETNIYDAVKSFHSQKDGARIMQPVQYVVAADRDLIEKAVVGASARDEVRKFHSPSPAHFQLMSQLALLPGRGGYGDADGSPVRWARSFQSVVIVGAVAISAAIARAVCR